MRNTKSIIVVTAAAAVMDALMGAATLAVTALPATADVSPSKPGQHGATA